MSAQKLPVRVIVLIAVHAVSTGVLAVFAWALTPSDSTPDGIGFLWFRALVVYIMISQIFLVVFWICLGQSAGVGRLVIGPMILGGVGAAFVEYASWGANWARTLLWLLVQLLVLAAPLLVLRLMGRRLVATAPQRETGDSSLRWSLKELMVAMTLGTIFIGLVRFLNLGREQLWGIQAILPLFGLACVVPVFFAARWWKLMLVVIVFEMTLTAAASEVMSYSLVEVLSGTGDAGINPPVQDTYFLLLRLIAIGVSITTTVLLGSLLVVRSCGCRWARSDEKTISNP